VSPDLKKDKVCHVVEPMLVEIIVPVLLSQNTLYPMILELPSCVGISQLKVIEVLVEVTLARVTGALGTVAARMALLGDSRESPTALMAIILNS